MDARAVEVADAEDRAIVESDFAQLDAGARLSGHSTFPSYQLVAPLPPGRLSEMCMWSRCRRVGLHFFFVLHEELR